MKRSAAAQQGFRSGANCNHRCPCQPRFVPRQARGIELLCMHISWNGLRIAATQTAWRIQSGKNRGSGGFDSLLVRRLFRGPINSRARAKPLCIYTCIRIYIVQAVENRRCCPGHCCSVTEIGWTDSCKARTTTSVATSIWWQVRNVCLKSFAGFRHVGICKLLLLLRAPFTN